MGRLILSVNVKKILGDIFDNIGGWLQDGLASAICETI